MKLTSLKPLHVDLAAIGVLLLLTGAAFMVGVYPVIQRYQSFHMREDELRARQGKDRVLSAQVAQVASKITHIQKELADDAIRLKSPGRINEQLARLASLTGKCGVKLDQLRPDKSLNGSRYQTVPIYLVGTGNFQSCVKILQELQRKFPDTSVASFEIKGDPAKPSEPKKLSVDLLWYALADMDLSKG